MPTTTYIHIHKYHTFMHECADTIECIIIGMKTTKMIQHAIAMYIGFVYVKYVCSNEICYFVHTTQDSALLVVLGTCDLIAPTKYNTCTVSQLPEPFTCSRFSSIQ